MMYQITYENGITQQKRLISHFDYKTVIVPDQYIAYALEVRKDTKAQMKLNKARASEIKKALVQRFGEEWFTDESPMFKAIKTGILDFTPWMNKSYNRTVTIVPVG